MDIDRRSLLRVAAGAAVASFVPVGTMSVAHAAEGAVATTPSGLSAMSMATFQRYVNTRFRFRVSGRWISLPLTYVTDERAAELRSGPAPSGECFSLNFTGPNPGFRQATYRVDHASLGRFHLFVVPVGRRSDGQDYQAVFNRMTG